MAETTAPDLGDWLLAHGRTSVTTAEASALLGIPPEQVRVRLRQPVQDRRLFTPSRGLWIPVPPEFRTWGVTPATYFLDDLMRHLSREYHVGWLSAAELWGAAHQRPQITQVAVDRPLADLDLGRVRLRYYRRSRLTVRPRVRRLQPSGHIWVSSIELTAFDLADHPDRGGGVSNVATVLFELAEEATLAGEVLAQLAAEFPGATPRRLGYLLERVGAAVDLADLRREIGARPLVRPAMLTPQGPRRGAVNLAWGVQVNADVEPDL